MKKKVISLILVAMLAILMVPVLSYADGVTLFTGSNGIIKAVVYGYDNDGTASPQGIGDVRIVYSKAYEGTGTEVRIYTVGFKYDKYTSSDFYVQKAPGTYMASLWVDGNLADTVQFTIYPYRDWSVEGCSGVVNSVSVTMPWVKNFFTANCQRGLFYIGIGGTTPYYVNAGGPEIVSCNWTYPGNYAIFSFTERGQNGNLSSGTILFKRR